ncbi:MAG: hemin uptake protein HemP [Planctomycetes bacterium]|nr:hemin uptake protein HemP [Planctomycetota bacterium]
MPEGTQDVHFVRSEELLKGQRELVIIHGDKAYRLLRTRNDKLILQK